MYVALRGGRPSLTSPSPLVHRPIGLLQPSTMLLRPPEPSASAAAVAAPRSVTTFATSPSSSSLGEDDKDARESSAGGIRLNESDLIDWQSLQKSASHRRDEPRRQVEMTAGAFLVKDFKVI